MNYRQPVSTVNSFKLKVGSSSGQSAGQTINDMGRKREPDTESRRLIWRPSLAALFWTMSTGNYLNKLLGVLSDYEPMYRWLKLKEKVEELKLKKKSPNTSVVLACCHSAAMQNVSLRSFHLMLGLNRKKQTTVYGPWSEYWVYYGDDSAVGLCWSKGLHWSYCRLYCYITSPLDWVVVLIAKSKCKGMKLHSLWPQRVRHLASRWRRSVKTSNWMRKCIT